MQNPEAANVTRTFNVCFSCFLLFWSIFSLILIPKCISTLYFILAKQSPPCDFRFGKKRQHLQLQCKKILLIQYAQACLRAGLSLTGSVFSLSLNSSAYGLAQRRRACTAWSSTTVETAIRDLTSPTRLQWVEYFWVYKMHTHVRVSAYHVACITGWSEGEESPWLPLCSGNPSASPLSLYGWSFLHCCSGLGVQSHEAQVHGHNEVIVNHTVLQDWKLKKKKSLA